jgi:uncharacterized protein (TIGR03083 family)
VDFLAPLAYTDTIQSASDAITAAGRSDLSAAVPSCPGWTVADVVSHVGLVHAWAATAVGSPGSDRPEFGDQPVGLEGTALVDWAEEQTAGLLRVLAATDPGTEVWTFGPPPTVRFWLRRQAQETGIHAWDATSALGSPFAMTPEVAADGVAEFVELWLARVLKRSPGSWSGESVHLHRTDGDGEWLMRLGPSGALAVEHTHAKGDLAVRAPAADLLLWLTNRVGLDQLESFGDLALAQRWRDEIAF